MITTENNQDMANLHKDLKQALASFPAGMDCLEVQLESSAKHIPAYIKIAKSHIDQLQRVLQSPNHNHKTLESVNLARPVQQLIEIFTKLEEEDLAIIENLAISAKNWHSEIEYAKIETKSSFCSYNH